MPNNNAHVDLSTEDLRMIGAAMVIAGAVVNGRARDIDTFERAVQDLEDRQQDWDNTLVKLIGAAEYAETYGNGDVSYA